MVRLCRGMYVCVHVHIVYTLCMRVAVENNTSIFLTPSSLTGQAVLLPSASGRGQYTGH